ncbi:MAG: Ku protein [Gemmatimonadaceae bacterium]
MPEPKAQTPDPTAQDEDYGRPFWTGTVSFGLVNVPVGLFPASRPLGVAMRMVTSEGTPLQRRYFSGQDGKFLPWDEIVRGYEVEKDEFVVLEEDELERVAPDKTNNIDLRMFVKASDIDPIYFERGYFMVPTGTNNKAYRLLARVMEDTGLAGVATFVMRAKEYIAAIFAENGILRAEMLRFADEVRTPESIELPKPVRVSEAEVSRIEKAIEKLADDKFSEKDLVDRSAVRLLDIVEKKVKKDQDVVELPEDEDEERADMLDLMQALERSLTSGRKRSARSKPARKRVTRVRH